MCIVCLSADHEIRTELYSTYAAIPLSSVRPITFLLRGQLVEEILEKSTSSACFNVTEPDICFDNVVVRLAGGLRKSCSCHVIHIAEDCRHSVVC